MHNLILNNHLTLLLRIWDDNRGMTNYMKYRHPIKFRRAMRNVASAQAFYSGKPNAINNHNRPLPIPMDSSDLDASYDPANPFGYSS